jgi:hypothetical protein
VQREAFTRDGVAELSFRKNRIWTSSHGNNANGHQDEVIRVGWDVYAVTTNNARLMSGFQGWEV